MRLVAYHQMSVQGHRFAQRRQRVEGRHRRLDFVADAAHVHHQRRRRLGDQFAVQAANHFHDPA